MRKAPEAFRTISEVAEVLRTPAHVLRFWESKFNQVKPVKRAGGRRYYRPADLVLLGGIRALLHDQGMTIRGVQKLLAEKGVRHVAGMAPENLLAELEGDETLEAEADEVTVDAAPDPVPDRAPSTADAATDASDDAPPVEGSADVSGPTDAQAAHESSGVEGVAAPPAQDIQAAPMAAPPEAPAADASKSAEAPEPGVSEADMPAASAEETAAEAPAATPEPETDAESEPEETEAEAERLTVMLRRMEPAPDTDRRAALASVARRMNALLDRMSKAGGAERW